ncbi:MAG: phosphotransferase [Alphaproteobacteria bacterium]|nr:phosphotransferase [Alphaproteobacteria bacterium]
MRAVAFSNPGRFFKGNLHTHCTNSDGRLTVDEVCRRYKARGYDFIAMTDHFVGLFDYPITDTRRFRDQDFTTLIGAELHSGAMDNGTIWHILAVGLPLDFTPSNSPFFVPSDAQECGAEIAARAAQAGAFVAIAHPEWSNLTEADMRTITAAHAVEIYNHGCEVESERGRGHHAADILATTGKRMNFIATDDAHFTHDEMDAFGGWCMVRATENTPEALLQALKDGAMYASTGPDFIDIEMDERYVYVRSSPVSAVILQGAGTRTAAEFGAGLTEVRIPHSILDYSPWIRVSLIDADGKKAWSNPIWKD